MSTFYKNFDMMEHFAKEWRKIKRMIVSYHDRPRLLEQAKERKHEMLIMFERFINHSITLRYAGDEWIEYVPLYKLVTVLDELTGNETVNDVLAQFEFKPRERGDDTYIHISLKEKAKTEE